MRRFGYPSEFDIIYGHARPLDLHRDDREFVKSIDWGQIERDKQTLIDNAYEYIIKGRGKSRKYLDIGEHDKKISDELINIGIKGFILILFVIMMIFLMNLTGFIDFSSLSLPGVTSPV